MLQYCAGYQSCVEAEELDSYHFGAREYKASLGVFLTRDPFRGLYGDPLTLHRYLYSLNDPINRLDPTGEVSALGITISATFGAASGFARWHQGGTALDIVTGVVSGVVGGAIGGQAWIAGAGLLAKTGMGMLSALAASGTTEIGHFLGDGFINGDWEYDFEQGFANLATSSIIGGALGSVRGLADWADDKLFGYTNQEMSGFFGALIGQYAKAGNKILDHAGFYEWIYNQWDSVFGKSDSSE